MLRAELGEDAIIVATQELPDGGVRITGAVESQDLDLGRAAGAGRGVALHRAPARGRDPPRVARRRCASACSRRRGAPSAGQPAAALAQALNADLPLRAAASAPAGALLLCGPPGAGKTASVAKLAAARRARAAGRSAVLTADTARAGGLEQLATLLAPLELQPQPAAEPGGPAPPRRPRREGAALLIDSPGLNPFRPADLGLLSSLLEASRAEPVLVLPAGLGVADSAEIGQTFAALGARRLHRDQARRRAPPGRAARGGRRRSRVRRGRHRPDHRPGAEPAQRRRPRAPAAAPSGAGRRQARAAPAPAAAARSA